MRLRSGHVTIAAIVLVTAFVVVAVFRGASGPGGNEVVEGALPPVNGSQDEVPSIAVDSTEVDLGVIPHDSEGHGRLAVHNRGRGPLNIMEVRSSCACTAGAFPVGALPIQPGASANLDIKVYPKRIYGFESKKMLTLYSNDPARPSVEVIVSAKVDPEFMLEPATFDFGKVPKGEAAVREIRLSSRLESPLKVTGLAPVQPGTDDKAPTGLALEVIPVPPAEWKQAGHEEYLLRAAISPDMPSGAIDLGAFVSTDIKRFPFLRIPVTGTVEAPYTLELPAALRSVIVQPKAADARVRVKAAVPVTLESASSEGGSVSVSGAVADGGLELVFTPAAGLTPGRHDDRVHLKLRADGRTFDELVEVRVFADAAAPKGT